MLEHVHVDGIVIAIAAAGAVVPIRETVTREAGSLGSGKTGNKNESVCALISCTAMTSHAPDLLRIRGFDNELAGDD